MVFKFSEHAGKMLPLNIFSVLLLFFTSLTAAVHNASTPRRRWNGVTANTDSVGPWPVDPATNSQMVYYCFGDDLSTRLQPVLADAIKKWYPAIGI